MDNFEDDNKRNITTSRLAVREVAEREIAICEPELLALTWTSLAMRAFLRATGTARQVEGSGNGLGQG